MNLWYNVSCDEQSEGNVKSHKKNLSGKRKRKHCSFRQGDQGETFDLDEGNMFCDL